jgi:hypothetical protein
MGWARLKVGLRVLSVSEHIKRFELARGLSRSRLGSGNSPFNTMWLGKTPSLVRRHYRDNSQFQGGLNVTANVAIN